MEKQEHDKWEKLRKYLADLQHTQILLLDMFRCQELSNEEYNTMVQDNQKSYMRFLRDIHKKPIDESDVLPDNE